MKTSWYSIFIVTLLMLLLTGADYPNTVNNADKLTGVLTREVITRYSADTQIVCKFVLNFFYMILHLSLPSHYYWDISCEIQQLSVMYESVLGSNHS